MSKNLKYLLLTKSVGCALNILGLILPKKAAELGYRLHSEPRVGKLRTEQLPDILENSIKSSFELEGVLYQSYKWQGNSEIILLVHGWESNSSRWELLLPFLIKTGKTIVAIDAPAHGLSGGKSFSVPKYAKIIDDICQKINPNYLIGHSIGGAACVFYQYKHQNANLKKMVILGAPSDLQVLINNFCILLGLNVKVKKYLTVEFAKQVDFPVENFSAINFGKEIKIPAMVVHDTSDGVVAFEESQKIIKHLENVTFLQTENLGHSLHDDKLYQQIADFILSKNL